MADCEFYKDNPTKKPTKKQKKYTHKRFRKAGKMLLELARTKYQGIKIWWY